LGDVLTKQAAANNKKGVVGMTGRNIPITPNATLNQPTISSKAFNTLFFTRFTADMIALS
jgi:hypothetical protein|tara:strand:- start:9308 stop:9487 length:180 start_codon:yes stop_codon:yes gene_type:complete